MQYKNLGTTISFKCYERKDRFYNILATYRPCKYQQDRFLVSIKLHKTVHCKGNEYLFEHPIDTQTIPATKDNIKNNISRIVNHAITYGKFDPYINSFRAEIEEALSTL